MRSFPDKGGKWQISSNGGSYPVWSSNGRDLLFTSEGDRIMTVSYKVKGETFVADKPKVWTEKRIMNLGLMGPANFDLAPDGKRVVALMPVDQPESVRNHMTLLLNFFDELRRRVPPNER